MSLHLDIDELAEVTGYRQLPKIKRALAEMRIQFRVRPADGFPLVERDYYKRLWGTSNGKAA